MGGRADYEERKEARKIRYERLAKKAEEKSEQYSNSTANRILEMTPGQPIIIGHHSENKARRLHERAWRDTKKSIEEDEKSKYYKNRAETVENSKVIYSDDPNAISKLKQKLEKLENEKASMKEQGYEKWAITNISATIRETKKRIERLERQENIEFLEIEFKGGKAIHNKNINRIQLLFEGKPSEEIRKQLKSKGFHWSRNEGAWQREFNENTIKATNILIRDVLNKEQQEEEEFE